MFHQDYSSWFQLKLADLIQKITASLVKEIALHKNEIELKTTSQNYETLLWVLKYNSIFQFSQLSEIICVDVITNKYRFKIVYILLSLKYTSRLAISIKTNEISGVNSISYLFNGACWLEREIWDLFGIIFYGNWDLRRILTDYGFQGHPLRKDFPLTGFLEIYFDDAHKQIVYEPVGLSQEYRSFTFTKSWKTE